MNPRLPLPGLRVLHPLRVEISVIEDFGDALRHVERFFAKDSVLAAILRLDDICRFLVYTALSEALAYERCRKVRETLRPTSIGWRLAMEPAWEALATLLEPGPVLGARCENHQDARGTHR